MILWAGETQLCCSSDTKRCRRSEPCPFHFEDLESLPRGRSRLRLRFSKTNQSGVGKLIPITNELASSIIDWSVACNGSGKILRGFYRGNKLRERMSPASINIRLKNLHEKEGVSDEALSRHSFRVGAAVDLLDCGESLEKIMLRGDGKAKIRPYVNFVRGKIYKPRSYLVTVSSV